MLYNHSTRAVRKNRVLHWREHLPPFLFAQGGTRLLDRRISIFVDESGDFGFKKGSSPFYLFTLVLHDQSDSLAEHLETLENRLANLGLSNHCIHTAPIIRNENEYFNYSYETRRSLMFVMRNFVRHLPVKVKTFFFDKNLWDNKDKLQARIARELGGFCRENLNFFQSFDSRVLYYDNGQSELGTVLNTVFNALLDVETKREVAPTDYRLFQLADYVCTLELVSIKAKRHQLSKSEERFFKAKELNKQFMKEIRKLYF